MFTAKTVFLTGSSTVVELTAGIDTDQEYMLHLRLESGPSATYGVYIGDASVSPTAGYLLTNSSYSGVEINPEITLRLQSGSKVYGVSNFSSTIAVDVLAYSA